MNARNRSEVRELLIVHGLVAGLVLVNFVGVFAIGVIGSLTLSRASSSWRKSR
jgi:hypothetical protein